MEIKEAFYTFFAILGFGLVYWVVVSFVFDTYKEAKDNHKKVEFGGFVISLVAVIISLFSFWLTYQQSERLEVRINEIEKTLNSTPSAEVSIKK